jgi:hypothetical protein
MTAYYIAGGLLALWAVLLSFLGIVREGFPKTDGSARIVMAVSVLLTLGAIGAGIIGGIVHEEDGGHETEAAALHSR